MTASRKKEKLPELISRAFRRDFQEFAVRAEALGIRVRSGGGRNVNGIPVYWAEGYQQLTGYTQRKDGGVFTADDTVAHIDKYLSSVEEDRRLMETMSEADRFNRVMSGFRGMAPRSRMIGEVRHPGGDRGHVFFMSSFDGDVNLYGIGVVARAKVEWEKGVTPMEQLSTFCDRLEADYAARTMAAIEIERLDRLASSGRR